MRRALLVALLAFVLGALSAPLLPLGSEQRTVVLAGWPNEEQRLRQLAGQGWVVRRADRVDGVGQLLTLERPRLLGLAELVPR